MFIFIMKNHIICIFLYNYHIIYVFGARSGPFKSILTRVDRCPYQTKPVDSNPPSDMSVEIYNSTDGTHLMRGNVTVFREHRIVQMRAKSYVWDGSKWKVSYLMSNLGCNKVFFPALCQATGVKYNPKNCSFNKGVFTFSKFDINKIQHVWTQTQEYGKILWRMELFSTAGSAWCYEFETLIEPS